jgi:hypothetical protein
LSSMNSAAASATGIELRLRNTVWARASYGGRSMSASAAFRDRSRPPIGGPPRDAHRCAPLLLPRHMRASRPARSSLPHGTTRSSPVLASRHACFVRRFRADRRPRLDDQIRSSSRSSNTSAGSTQSGCAQALDDRPPAEFEEALACPPDRRTPATPALSHGYSANQLNRSPSIPARLNQLRTLVRSIGSHATKVA